MVKLPTMIVCQIATLHTNAPIFNPSLSQKDNFDLFGSNKSQLATPQACRLQPAFWLVDINNMTSMT